MKQFDKQPSEVLDYDIDATEWLTQGDNVIGAAITIDITGLVLDSSTINDDRIKIWLSAGVDGITYKVTTKITTEDGRVKEVDFNVRVRDI